MTETKEILTLAVEIADLLLRNGGEIYRVEDTVIHILDSYQIEDYDVYVLSNGIFASANENKEDACSMIRHVPLGKTHLGRVIALNQLSREICSGKCSVEQAWIRLEECKKLPEVKGLSQIFFCGLGSAGFCYLFGGQVLDALFAFFLGMLLQIYLNVSKNHHASSFTQNIFGSGIVTICSLLVLHMGLPVFYDKIIIGCIMPLVPGIALTTSIRDFFNSDYLSGTIHLIDALLTSFSIAVGVGAVITIYRLFTGGVLL